ncbi:MAG: hypothetical protein ACLQPD_06610 [Desulfomonilaceae bacterium]
MTNYELHEYAEIFPSMSATELEQLEEDIKANGLHHSVILYQGKILDGRHRYEICKKHCTEAIFDGYNGDDPLGCMVSANFSRGHMSDGQRAMVAARLKEKGWSSANLRSKKKSKQAAAALHANAPMGAYHKYFFHRGANRRNSWSTLRRVQGWDSRIDSFLRNPVD